MAGPITDLSQFNAQRMDLAGVQPFTDTLKQIPGVVGQVSRQQDANALKAWQDQGVEGLVAAGRELGLDETTIRRIGSVDYNKGLEYVAKQAEAAKKNKYFETIGNQLKGLGDAPEIKFLDNGQVDPKSYAAWMNWRNDYEGAINKGIVGATDPMEQEVWDSKQVSFSKMTAPTDSRVAENKATQQKLMNDMRAQKDMSVQYSKALADTKLKDMSGAIDNLEAAKVTLNRAVNSLNALKQGELPYDAFKAMDTLLSQGTSTFGGKVLNAALNWALGNKQYQEDLSKNEAAVKEAWALMRGGTQKSVEALNRFRFAVLGTIMNHIKEMSGAAVSDTEAARYDQLFNNGKGMDMMMSSMSEWASNQEAKANSARNRALAQFAASTRMYRQYYPENVAEFEALLSPDNSTAAAFEEMSRTMTNLMSNAIKGQDLSDRVEGMGPNSTPTVGAEVKKVENPTTTKEEPVKKKTPNPWLD